MRQFVRGFSTRSVARSYSSLQAAPSKLSPIRPRCLAQLRPSQRCFSVASIRCKGLSPDSEEPAPKESQPMETEQVKEPTPLEDDEYHERSEQYLEEIVSRVEELQEGKEDLELDYSVNTTP